MSHETADILVALIAAVSTLILAVAGLMKAWASVKEVGLKETARRAQHVSFKKATDWTLATVNALRGKGRGM